MFLSVRTTAFTRTLTLPALNPDRERKLRLITQLYDQGITTRQLSDWFNDLKIPTPRGTKWSPKLVYMTVAKWKKRQARIKDKYLVSTPPRFFLLDHYHGASDQEFPPRTSESPVRWSLQTIRDEKAHAATTGCTACIHECRASRTTCTNCLGVMRTPGER